MAEIFSILCLAMVVGKFVSIFATDYCNLDLCKRTGEIHTMCKYTSPQPAARCMQWTNQGLTDSEKKIIVAKHNQLRRKVASGRETRGNPGPQPAAISMPDLKWDNELEIIAQRWANQCDFKHDECRNVDSYVVGQNIASTSNSAENKSTMKSMIEMWYNEVKDFNTNDVSSYKFDPNTGHYSQIVWAKTMKIGCGLISYKENGWNKKYLVCNYGPAGNYENEEVYKVK